jgi:hypothetical protein
VTTPEPSSTWKLIVPPLTGLPFDSNRFQKSARKGRPGGTNKMLSVHRITIGADDHEEL